MKRILILLLVLSLAATATATAYQSTYYLNTSADDGYSQRAGVNLTWADVRDGAGTDVDTTSVQLLTDIKAGIDTNKYSYLHRSHMIFNTSDLQDSDIWITSATIRLTTSSTSVLLGDMGVGLTNFTIDGTISADDYDNCGNTLESDYKNVSTAGVGTTNTWTLNTLGRANISKTGLTGFCIRMEPDISNTAYWTSDLRTYFGVWSANHLTVSEIPLLTVNYDLTPTAGFTASATSGPTPLSVTFTDASTNYPTNWDWYWYDNETKSSDLENPTATFTPGTYNVRLFSANSAGSGWHNETGYISVSGYALRSRAVTAMPTISESRYNAIVNTVGLNNTSGTGAAPNWTGLVQESVGVYTDALGPFALILLFLIPFGMAFVANRSMKGIAILGILVSLFVFMYLPSNYTAAAMICIAVAAAALIWSLFKQQ